MRPVTGTLANVLTDLSAGLNAFYLDLQSLEDRYLLYAKSEFGRRWHRARSTSASRRTTAT
ncbi:MAG: hypothetical protein AAF957_11170 [Planctomycetota bacterium]